MNKLLACVFALCCCTLSWAQSSWDVEIQKVLPDVLKEHRAFVSIPNVATDEKNMYRNLEWATSQFEARSFDVRLLESSSLPVFFAEKQVDPGAATILFYLHIDGQAVDADLWDQPDPWTPVLKKMNSDGQWEIIDWANIDGDIDPDWRVYARAAADDKAPIMMLLTAIELLSESAIDLQYNVKVILDPQEEARSHAFLSTLEKYKKIYESDYLIIMDGPAHPSNRPTLTLGCRGIATCSITLYGAELPQHSGHYGNYVPNPVFRMARLLASMKDDEGRVTIAGYYDNISFSEEVETFLNAVPDDDREIVSALGMHVQEQVGPSYQKSLQYPSLNVRHIETSWKGPGLKTVIPEVVTAHIDVRLVKETDGNEQIAKIYKHIEDQGYLILDREPTKEERLEYDKIATFISGSGVNAFRTEVDAPIVTELRKAIRSAHNEDPVLIRTMGGTVPIIEAIDVLDIEAIIVPMVNMDNNQHNPNENIRIGNIIDGIKTCMAILSMDLEK